MEVGKSLAGSSGTSGTDGKSLAQVMPQFEDTLLAGMAQPQHPWVETNLRAAVYNLADENIRYLYNNWVALLAKSDDRDRAIRPRAAHTCHRDADDEGGDSGDHQPPLLEHARIRERNPVGRDVHHSGEAAVQSAA